MKKKVGHKSHISGGKRRHKGQEKNMDKFVKSIKKLFKGVKVI